MSLESYAEATKRAREKLKATRFRFESRILDPLFDAWSKETGTKIRSHGWLWGDVPNVPLKDDHLMHRRFRSFCEWAIPCQSWFLASVFSDKVPWFLAGNARAWTYQETT